MDTNAGRNDAAAEERAGCEAPAARRNRKKRRRWAGALALALAAACLGALAGGGAALGLYRVATVASLPAVEVAPAEWARCYEDGACYDQSDGWGSYYVRYAGSDAKVDVSAALDAEGKLCGTEVTSTYKMFAGAHVSLEEVRLPDIAQFGGKLDSTMFASAASPSVDVLYREAGATADSGLAVASENVTPWLVVTGENVDAGANAYRGSAKNVYVSSDVPGLSGLFSGSSIECAWLDPDEANIGDMGARYMFANCMSLKGLKEGSALPRTVTDASYMFSGCNALASLPSSFSLPDLQDAASMFSDCSSLAVDALPNDFKLPSTICDASGFFNGCVSLDAVPNGFLDEAGSLSSAASMFAGSAVKAVPVGLLDSSPGLIDASSMFEGAPVESAPEDLFRHCESLMFATSLFASCEQLSGSFDLPSSVIDVEGMVDGAGASAAAHPYDDKGENVGDAGAYSVIVRYDRSAATGSMKAYIDGVNGTAGVRARFVPYLWEKVPSDDGPYEDPTTNGKFYLRYTGSDPVVDVQDHMDESGAIRGVKVATTDRMFQGLDANVGEVVLPDVSGFATNVDPNTFGGDLGHKVDLRYRASLSDAEDHCSTLNASDAANATAWLYLEDSNLTGGTYKGKARNVYVSENVSSLKDLFESNESIVACDVSDEGSWTDASFMLAYCSSLTTLSNGFLSKNTELKTAYYMLYYCTSLESLPDYFLSDALALTNVEAMLCRCTSLVSLPVGFLSGSVNLKNASYLFSGCKSLSSIPDGFLSSNVNLTDARKMFMECTSLTTLPDDLLSSNVKLTDVGELFSGCKSLSSIPDGFLSSNVNLTNCSIMLASTSLSSIPDGFLSSNVNLTDARSVFQNCKSLSSIPDGFLSSNVNLTNVGNMFYGCKSLSSIPDGFLSSNVNLRIVENLFEGCTGLKSLPAGFLSSNVNLTDVSGLFSECTNLESLPDGFLSVAPKLTDVSFMLSKCKSLKSLPAGFLSDVPKLTTTLKMFSGCTSLESLPDGFLSEAPKLTNASAMLYSCGALVSLPGGFLSASMNLENASSLFYGAGKLRGELTLPASITDCSNLLYTTSSDVDGDGLIYDSAGVNAGAGNGAYAFVIRYPDSNSALSKYAATVNGSSAYYAKVVMVPISGVATTAEIGPEADDPQTEATETAPVEDEVVGIGHDAKIDVSEEESGVVAPPPDEAVPDDVLDEPLPDEGESGDASDKPPLPDDSEAAPLPDDPEVEPLPEDGEADVPAPDAPEEPAGESEAAVGSDEARVMVRPEREEGPLSADPPGIVAVAAGGLGVGEYFRRRRDGSKGQD